MDICLICYHDPTSHSFSKICETENVCHYYTKPAAATKYNDQIGILAHVDNLLNKYKGRQWTWTIDGTDFALKHAMEVGTIRKILNLISKKYMDTLLNIKVINMNKALENMYYIIKPFLNKNMSSKITFVK